MRALRRVIGCTFPIWVVFLCPLVFADFARPENAYQSLVDTGTTLLRAGEFWDAIPAFERALGIAKTGRRLRQQLDCLLNLGTLNWNIGELKRSEALYIEAFSLSRKMGIRSIAEECSNALKIHDLYRRGKAARLDGRFRQSIGLFEAAIALADSSGRPEFGLKCLRQLSLNYLELERMNQFLPLAERALCLAKKLKHRTEEARGLNNLGLFYFKSNRYSKALALYDEALAIAKQTSRNETDETDCLNNISLVYLSLGDYEKALRMINEAFGTDLKTGDQENIMFDLKNMGAMLRNKGEYTHGKNDFYAALEYYLESLDIAKRIKRDDVRVELLNNLGLTYASLGQVPTALSHFRTALVDATALGRKGDTGTILCNIGQTYLQIGEFKQAKTCFHKALDLALRTNRDEVLWEIYFGLGKCLENEGELDSALSCYRKAADITDVIRHRLSWDDQKTSFARDKWKIFDAWVDALLQAEQAHHQPGRDIEIWRTIERAKARAFIEELSQVENPRRRPQDPGDVQAQKQLTRKISLTISELASSGLSKDKRRDLLASLEREEDNYASLINRFRADITDSPSIPEGIPSLESIRTDLLDQETAILEFFLGERRSLEVLITQTHLIVKPLPSRASIEDSLRAYLKLISAPPKGRFPGIEAARRIYKDYISPFENQLSPSIRNLVIIPDGILCYLPFETLVRGDGCESAGRFLIESYQISYAPSVSSLAILSRPRSGEAKCGRILALGSPVYSSRSAPSGGHQKQYADVLREIYLDNGFDFSELPFSKMEVMQIAKAFSPRIVDAYVGPEAKEEVIKNASLTDYRIIHFACHGFLDETEPLRSALVLSMDDDPEEDGFLQAREIYELRLKADLVVLSACQTGQGRLEYGEGVLGLPRMFFCAGARSTISSLWKISDRSTSSLMGSFYRSLAAGANKAMALRQAKLMMLKTRLAHPFYWAGFVLNGDYRSRLTDVPVTR